MKSPNKREDLEAKYDVVLDFPNLELHSAAASGNVGLVQYALTHGQPVNSVLHGVLPLHAACSGGSVSVVRMLIENGADVNAPRLPRRYSDGKKGTAPSVGTAGSTPLHFAAANGHAPVVQMLLASGADATKPDKNGNTPEDLATINGHEDVLRVLQVYHHLKHQDALNDPSNSEKGESSSPAASTSQLPDEEDSSSITRRPGWILPSRKGKERAFSLTSSRSEGANAGRLKNSLDGFLLRRASRYSAGGFASDHRSTLDSPTEYSSAIDSPISQASGSAIVIEGEPGGNESNVIPRISTISDISLSSIYDSDQLRSPLEIEIPGSPSPQKGTDSPLIRVDSDNSGQASPRSLTRVMSGQSSKSNSTSIILASPPNSAGLPPPSPSKPHQRARVNSSSSHRPTLPSILEKAVHPGQAFRAAMRHHNNHNNDKVQSSPDLSTDSHINEHDNSSNHSSSGGGGGFFRGRKKSQDSDLSSSNHNQHKKHGHKHGFKGFFRRGHSPPSRSPSPPMKTDNTKPIAAEELEEGIERLKRASIELDRQGHQQQLALEQDQEQEQRDDYSDHGIDPSILDAISLRGDDDDTTPHIPQMPLSAPVTKTKFFPDSPNLPSRLSTRSNEIPSSAPSERPFNRPRTGSEVIAPSPLANAWAHDEDSDSSLRQTGIRRVKTEIIKSPISSPSISQEEDNSNPTSPSGSRRRSATHSGGLLSPIFSTFFRSVNTPRTTGLGWGDEVDLRKVAASGLIRRESQRRQAAEVDSEMDAEEEVYHDAVSPDSEPQSPVLEKQETLEKQENVEGEEKAEDEDDSTPTPPSGLVLDDSTPTAELEEEQLSELPEKGVESSTTEPSRLSVSPTASFRTSNTNDSDDLRNQKSQLKGLSMSTIDNRPRGKSVSSISSTASGMGYSYAQSTSTPPTSLTTPSALSLALVSGFPPVPEDEVASVVSSAPINRRTMTQRTISSHAEAREVVKQNEDDILHLAQLPPSFDSNRSLAEQLAAYGENYAIERQFAEIERRHSGLTGNTGGTGGKSRSEDGESFFSAESSNLSYGSSQSSIKERRRQTNVGGLQPRALSNPLVPLVDVDAPRSSLPSINNIYDKRADAYKKHMATLTSVQPLLPSSTRHAQKRARQRAVSAQEQWLTSGTSNNRHNHQSRPNSSANSIMSFGSTNEYDVIGREAAEGEEKEELRYPIISNPITGQRPVRKSSGSAMSIASSHHSHHHHHNHHNHNHDHQPSSGGHSRNHTVPRPTKYSNLTPNGDILSTRYQGIGVGGPSSISSISSHNKNPIIPSSSSFISPSPSNNQRGNSSPSPYVSIFSNKYQSSKIPYNEDDSDDENDNNREFTVIENDWRGGHIVNKNKKEKDKDELNNLVSGVGSGNEGKKKWGLKKIVKLSK